MSLARAAMPLSIPAARPAPFSEAARRVLPVVGRSRASLELLGLVESLAGTSANVLVTGESGSGKELVARLLHETGERPGRYLAHNCAALAEGTLESDLFGHVAGAFTGAAGNRRGLFEEADGGTLFLDEIGEIAPGVQVRLLRALQEGEIKRVGESTPRRVSVRVIAATNRNLAAEVRAGKFREDLFYRLNGITVRVPALRERRGDIPLFVRHFVECSVRGGEPLEDVLGPEVLEALVACDWPGNLRQLANEVQRVAIVTRGRGPATPASLSPEVLAGRAGPPPVPAGGSFRERVNGAQREILLGSLRRNRWNKAQTARSLGISRQGLIKMIRRLGLPSDPAGEGGSGAA
ncbi:MAG: sigma 54-interacting transcriptional regulator [Gemmatimonadota bacterium]|nr:sigma 54-interacting transcriptional regulator [Gemmatimonadota bacterium]